LALANQPVAEATGALSALGACGECWPLSLSLSKTTSLTVAALDLQLAAVAHVRQVVEPNRGLASGLCPLIAIHKVGELVGKASLSRMMNCSLGEPPVISEGDKHQWEVIGKRWAVRRIHC